jgi:hypothetical protein
VSHHGESGDGEGDDEYDELDEVAELQATVAALQFKLMETSNLLMETTHLYTSLRSAMLQWAEDLERSEAGVGKFIALELRNRVNTADKE